MTRINQRTDKWCVRLVTTGYAGESHGELQTFAHFAYYM